MGVWILLLVIAVVMLWRTVSGLRDRIEFLESRLQRAVASEPKAEPEPEAEPAPEPEPETAREPIPEPTADERPERAEVLPVLAPAAASAPILATDAAEPMPDETTAPEPAAPTAESWEVVVGTSWLNKIGVLVSIIGVALLVSYSFTRIGPAGRVAVGLALSTAMLAAGVILERRPVYRNYAYGLVAGGWGGVYFTTFAMHGIPAARIVESDLLGISLLFAVAAGMIGHSLRYRSQVVTSLAYIVAYATLALSPLTGFSLVSSIPLAVSVLIVSQRFGWTGISTLGVVSTFGVFLLRYTVTPRAPSEAYDLLPYATVAAFWLTFEAADIIGMRLGAARADAVRRRPVSMLTLNAVGLFGAALLLLPPDDPAFVSNCTAIAGAAYLASAILRARLAPSAEPGPDERALFTSRHGAAAIAAALFAWAIDLRFAGNRETLALLAEAELLLAAGLTLADRWIRRFGAAAAVLTTLHAWALGIAGQAAVIPGPWPIARSSAVLWIVAIVWYANREAVHRRTGAAVGIDRGYSWAATALLATAFALELSPAHQGLAGLLLAAVLLEGGLRRGSDLVAQSYLLGLLSGVATLLAFLTPAGERLPLWGAAPTSGDVWLVLPVATLLAFGYAVRVARRRDTLGSEALLVAGASACFGTAFLAVFEWQVLAPNAVAPVWAATALGLIAVGDRRRIAAWRWQGYALVFVAGYRAVTPLLLAPPPDAPSTTAIALVIAGLYAAGYLGRRAASPTGESRGVAREVAASGGLTLLATASLALFKWRVLPEHLVAPAWAVTAVVLVALGLSRGRPGQRLQGYALAILAGGHVVLSVAAAVPLSARDALLSATVAALIYTAAALARRAAAAPTSEASREDPESIMAGVLSVIATGLLVLIEDHYWANPRVGPAWVATAAVVLGVGLWKHRQALRWQGYVLLFLGALRCTGPLWRSGHASTEEIFWLAAVVLLLYGTSFVIRPVTRRTVDEGVHPAEAAVRVALSIAATVMLGVLLLRELPDSMVTPALGLQGIALLFVGIPAHERAFRLSGLGVLLVCILKLFLFDLRELEPLARIVAFVVLGLFLLAVSWSYTRFREQIRRFL